MMSDGGDAIDLNELLKPRVVAIYPCGCEVRYNLLGYSPWPRCKAHGMFGVQVSKREYLEEHAKKYGFKVVQTP